MGCMEFFAAFFFSQCAWCARCAKEELPPGSSSRLPKQQRSINYYQNNMKIRHHLESLHHCHLRELLPAVVWLSSCHHRVFSGFSTHIIIIY